MDTSPRYDTRTVKPKKGGPPPSAPNLGPAAPTTFFLKSEKQLEKSTQQRGRKTSRGAEMSEDTAQKTPMASHTGENSFGVQSLEETINSTFSSDSSLSRTDSIDSTDSVVVDDDVTGPGLVMSRKRKAGNRVHPTILATGQRIISSERHPRQASTGASPAPSSESPLRHPRLRRGSANSTSNMSQPLTPIKLSPHPESAFASTPRSASPKSFRLSDEDSITDETSSQALLSSSGDDEEQVERMPQLVMPSLSMPARRPFTERGRQIGRSKIMVLGQRGIGKSSLIKSICRKSEDIVHVDQTPASLPSQSSFNSGLVEYDSTSALTEISASTRPFPSWWTGGESVRSSQRRRSSVGEGVLERNLTFLDMPGQENDDCIQRTLDTLKLNIQRTTTFDRMSDSELVEMLGGSGGVQIDAVLYLFDPALSKSSSPADFGLSALHQELLQILCTCTNFIPLIGRADTMPAETLAARKQQIAQMLYSLQAEPYSMTDPAGSGQDLALAVSSALEDDGDEIDASILMSSQYMQPLVPSELDMLVDRLLAPSNIARMRHLSAVKCLQWRQTTAGDHLGLHKQTLLQSPFPRSVSPGVTSNGSLLEDNSKVLVPRSQSSYYRSGSPAVSDSSAQSGQVAGTPDIARYNEQAQPSEPFRRIRLAKWAQDLQRSLDNERRKYQKLYTTRAADWSSEDSEKSGQALISTKDGSRPARGRLGGDLGVIDPRDPLGVLAFGQVFRRRSFFVLQIVGSCGLIGAVAYWVVKNWIDVQDFFGFGQPQGMVSATAVPAPVQRNAWLEDNSLRGFFGWTGR